MASIVIKHPDGSSQEHVVSEQLTVGRSEGNDLVLTEGGVSRKHARFFIEGGDILVEDIGSANGTWVDGSRIEGPTKLESANQVVIGDYEIAVKNGGAPKRSTGSQRAARPGGGPKPKGGEEGGVPRSTRVVPAVKGQRPGGGALAKRPPRPGGARGGGSAPVLKGLSGVANGKSFKVSGKMVVGRVAGVDIQIEDDSVSRKHAEVEARGRKVVVRDLGSANGTTVNGLPAEGDVELQDGDILQFGVVEVAFESGGSGSSASVPARPSGRAPRATGGYSDPGPSMTFDGDGGEGMPPQRKKLFMIGGGVLGLLFVVVLIKAIMGPGAAPPPPDRPIAGGMRPGPGPQVAVDPAKQIEDLLVRCRSYASSDYGKPDWEKAEAACNKVLELEPIHADANELLRKIKVERACEENLNKGRELKGYNRHDEALEYFGKITEACPSFFLKAINEAKESVLEVRKTVGRDCQTYARANKWENALKSCELYTRLACQTMSRDELYPPPLTKLKLDGPLRKGDWRPKDPLYTNYLRARAKLQPDAPDYQCPEIKVLRPPPPPPDPGKQCKEQFKKRLSDPELSRALALYYDGVFSECRVPLQKVQEKVEKAALHELAKDIFRDMSLAIDMYQAGTADMTNDKIERAAEAFHKAVEMDELVILGKAEAGKMSAEQKRRELERCSSFIRRAIIDSMSNNAYRKGKEYADRKDFRQACKTWKLGLDFSRGNVDLLKAATFCSTKAQASLASADSCEALKSVLDFAVDGDGSKEQVDKYMVEYGCR